MTKTPHFITSLLILILVFALSYSGFEYFINTNASITDENRFMEMYQSIFLFISACIFALQIPKTQKLTRVLTIFLSLLSLIMLHREVETVGLAVPDIVHLIFSRDARWVIIAPAIFLLFYLIYRVPYFWAHKARIAVKTTTKTLFIGIVCYAFLNEVFENGLVTGVYDIFFEEAVEMLAATLFCIAGVYIARDYGWMAEDT